MVLLVTLLVVVVLLQDGHPRHTAPVVVRLRWKGRPHALGELVIGGPPGYSSLQVLLKHHGVPSTDGGSDGPGNHATLCVNAYWQDPRSSC